MKITRARCIAAPLARVGGLVIFLFTIASPVSADSNEDLWNEITALHH
jgi:hypothetical protein